MPNKEIALQGELYEYYKLVAEYRLPVTRGALLDQKYMHDF